MLKKFHEKELDEIYVPGSNYESAAELLQSAQAVKNKLQQDKHRKV